MGLKGAKLPLQDQLVEVNPTVLVPERGEVMQHLKESSWRTVDHQQSAPLPDDRPPSSAQPATMVPISRLVFGSSPRLNGQDQEHIRRLAETDSRLPPILVQRHTMLVIDGAHRVRAAQMCGRDVIGVLFYDGGDDDAFVIAVERNIVHGMPLTRADRQAAAVRIIATHPHWSDRAIAARTGLSDRTVRSIRSTAGLPQSNNGRLGRDGRVRPLSAADGRRRAAEILAKEPATPLRKVAEAAGVSLATTHDVRQRMLRGDDPVAGKRNDDATRSAPSLKPSASKMESRCLPSMLRGLMKDPSLKYTEFGRSFLRWLHTHAIENKDWESISCSLPEHCRQLVADVARNLAEKWQDFALELESPKRTPSCCPNPLMCAARGDVSQVPKQTRA